MTTTPHPGVVEVFGDDGELFPLLIDDETSNEAIEDGIQILEQRHGAIRPGYPLPAGAAGQHPRRAAIARARQGRGPAPVCRGPAAVRAVATEERAMKLECDLCGEQTHKHDARETVDGDLACPDCVDGMKECPACEMLFSPETEDEQEQCEYCREDHEDSGQPAETSADQYIKEEAARVLETVATSLFYERQKSLDEKKSDAMPGLRAEVAALLAGMDDPALSQWALMTWWRSAGIEIGSVDKGKRPDDAEMARRLALFTAEIRASLTIPQTTARAGPEIVSHA